MNISLTLNSQQFREMRRQIDALNLPPRKQERLLWRILQRGVMPAARAHQRRQESADGVKWPGRARGGKKKMLRQLPKMMAIRQMPAKSSALIYLRGSKRVPPGVVGAAQQGGQTVTVTASQAKAQKKTEGMATLKQARRLRQLGYMQYPVTDPRVAKLDEILVSLTRDKAGLIIRNMEGREAKKTWKNTLPAREFLAVSDDEFNKILARQLQAVNYGLGVRAQDVKGKVKR